MKKFLLIVIILAGLIYLIMDTETAGVENNVATDTGKFQPDPSSATFSFDDGSVTLSNGRGEEDEELVELLEKQASGDLNADNKEDTVVLMARSGGGSGIFIYIAGFVSGPINHKGTNAVFVGDRISPQSISIAKGVVTLKYLDRETDEPLSSEPTVPKSIEYVYKNSKLQER